VNASRENARKLRLALEHMLADIQIAADAARALETSLPPEPDEESATGRPPVVPTVEQRVEVIRLKYANGRLGLRRIAKRVNKRFPAEGERRELNWEHVQTILAEYDAASENSQETSEKPFRAT
jgi:hypothetical protein